MEIASRFWRTAVWILFLSLPGCGRDWVPGPYTGEVVEDVQCLPGDREGVCGMEGRCVECIADADCREREVCSERGRCEPYCGSMKPCRDDEFCKDGLCHPRCNIHMDCPSGMMCRDNRYCYRRRCSEEGICPDGWEPLEGSLACRMTRCPYNFMFGTCGFEGLCVMCNHDSDCPYLFVCDPEDGLCYRGDGCINDSNCFTPGTVCREGRCIHPCGDDADCSGMEECREGRCTFVCRHDGDCPYGYLCRDESCYAPLCDQEQGTCPEGWSFKDRSMVCKWDPCSEQGLMPGACGLAGTCVECFLDEHCGPGLVCSDAGNCTRLECEDNSRCDGTDVCFKGRCVKLCGEGADCGDTERCDPRSRICLPVRCNSSGSCLLEGYYPVPGSLRCELQEQVQVRRSPHGEAQMGAETR